jgi:hypothetical protein
MAGNQKGDNRRDAPTESAYLAERREKRYSLPVEVEVSGIDRDGQVFRERTLTRNVSEWGCGFPVSVELKADDIIALRVIYSDVVKSPEVRQSLFQVRSVTREENGWLVGAWKVDEGKVWGTDLEKIAESEQGAADSRKEETAKHKDRPRRDADQ